MQWIAVPHATGRRPTPSTSSAVVDVAVRSLAAHEQYLRALGVDDPQAFATELVDGQTSVVAERFGGRPGSTFELIPGPAAPSSVDG